MPRDAWAEATLAARLLAVDPALGASLRGPPGPARDGWLAGLRANLPGAPWRRLPPATSEARLIGGLDLPATLATGRPVAARGLLAEADGGVVVAAAAERLDEITASHLCRVLDTGIVRIERDGIAAEADARIAVVALDDGRGDDEGVLPALLDRLAFRLDLAELSHRDCGLVPGEPEAVAAARARLPGVAADADVAEALCAAAEALGVAGLRAPLQALRVARVAAALAGREAAGPDDVSTAARLVLGPRATRIPSFGEAPAEPDPAGDRPEQRAAEGSLPSEDGRRDGVGDLDGIAVEAAAAALPSDLLASLPSGAAPLGRAAEAGARRGSPVRGGTRGRPVGDRRGDPGRGARLDLVATLRAAAPWQALRGRATAAEPLRVRRDDFRVARHADRQRTTTIFAVDASGSAALGRLAEAKGAVELLLADCYIRRDDVALLAFRGAGAEVLLAPTRAPARAKRALAELPGGGATPLAAGLAAALDLAAAARRGGRRPAVAVLTDGRANVARDGTADRARAGEDALAAARLLRAAGIAAVVIDVSPRPGPAAERLASAMGAAYLPLPMAGARGIAEAVRAVAEPAGGRA